MKTIILTFALISVVWSFPKGEELRYKNRYVTPKVPVTPDTIPRIVNGRESIPHSIPYQVFLIITDNRGDGWLCGGSLISPRFVLTAGHCVVDSRSADVYLGAHNPNIYEPTQVIITSRNLTTHEGYNDRTISNDIGLITLPEPVELNEYINVVPLPRRGAVSTYEGANSRMSGWGLTNGHANNISPVLREVNSTVISNRECDRVYGIVESYQICTSGAGGVATCGGDSGGPLVAGNELIGITSYGVEYCDGDYPSAFTRVTSFLDWLERNTDLRF